jgi:hypothetical protein
MPFNIKMDINTQDSRGGGPGLMQSFTHGFSADSIIHSLLKSWLLISNRLKGEIL